MKVALIGPGAMGCLFAARFAQHGIHTTLVDYRADRAARLEQKGITVETRDGIIEAHPNVMTHVPTLQHLIIVLTKAYSTSSLRFPPDAPVLTLQNGLGNVEALCGIVGSARMLAGVTSEGATLLGEGRVRHAGSGVTSVGSWTSCDVKPAVEAFERAGFNVEVTEAPGKRIWEKVAVSSGINPLTALLNVPNGRLTEIKEIRQLMRDLVVESAKVAATEGYRFEQSLVELAEEICRQTADNISSMLQDVRNGKRTETESISGEVLRRAQLAGLPVPRTQVIYQLMKGLESR